MALAAATPVVSPVPAVAAASPVAALALQAGQVVDALVLKLIGDAGAQLVIANTVIDVATTTPLVPGAQLRLAVERDAGGLKLVLQPAASHGEVTPPAVSAAAQDSANGETVGAGAVLSSRLAGLVSAGRSAAVANVSQPASPSPPLAVVAPSPEQAALSQAVGRAAAQQDSLAPVFANVAVAAAHETLPPEIQDAALRMLSLRSGLTETLSGQDIESGLSRSGIFLEARLSAVAAAGEGGARVALPDDLKAALLSLRQVLSGFLQSAEEGDAPSPAFASPALDAGSPAVDVPRAAAATPPVAPPYRGAAPSAQPVISAAIAPDDGDVAAARLLLGQTDAGIARQTLMQAASLPDAGHPDRASPQGSNWAFEIPFATPQGTAMAQLEVARDGRRDAADSASATWRARFSIDIESIGPVHAHIAISGARTAVTLWAERSESAAALRDNASLLTEGLRGAELEQGEVLVRDGRPPRSPATSGHFLDRAS